MKEGTDTIHLYTDLAWLWPMWGDYETEYFRYCEHVIRLIDRYAQPPARSLLDISCGGGKNVYSLKKRFSVTGLDLSCAMINLAAALNPECRFIEGDMRDFSLGRTFDAVLMDDGISHMTNRTDLSTAFECAYRHLRPGGVMVVTPDVTAETFRQSQTTCTEAVGRRKPKGMDVTFIENLYDSDPTDEIYEETIIYLIREGRGLRIETDRFKAGLFSLEIWTQTLSNAGFSVYKETFVNDVGEYISFACVRS